MGYTLTAATELAAARPFKTPQLILEIDGIDTIYSMTRSLKVARYGDGFVYGEPGLFYGTGIVDPKFKSYISLSGTTKQLTQQLDQDKGGTGSVSNMNISIIDKNNFVSNELSSLEMLSRKAKVYLSFKDLEHPLNSVRIFNGIVSDFSVTPGIVSLKIDNPDSLKRRQILVQIIDNLDGAITNSTTSITINNTSGIKHPSQQTSTISDSSFSTYVQIEDEIILVGGISGNTLTSCTRGQLGTTAVSHEDDEEVKTFYRLEGKPLDLVLKLMLSGADEVFETVSPTGFVNGVDGIIDEAVYFNMLDIRETLGVVSGDFVSITNTDGGTNDTSFALIKGSGKNSDGTSYLVIDGVTIGGVTSSTTVNFSSKYNVLPFGCGLHPDEVDVEQHLYYSALVGATMPDLDFYIKETITNAKDFLEKELYFPIGGYFLGRKGRSSMGFTLPPLAGVVTPTLNSDNVLNPSKINIKRSTSEKFYNVISYKFEENALDDKWLAVRITEDEDSFNRIRSGFKTFAVESKGLRNNAATKIFIDSISTRLLERYKFAASSFDVDVQYGIGFSIEVGDIVLFDGAGMLLYNPATGNRTDYYGLMEVINKSLNISTGSIKLKLLDTSYDLSGRYATVSPSSYIGSGATTTILPLKTSQGTATTNNEVDKWEQFVGSDIEVSDFGSAPIGVVRIIGITEDRAGVIVDALPSVPTEDFILRVPEYSNSNTDFKLRFAALSPTGVVGAGSTATRLVANTYIQSKVFVGSVLDVHNADYTNQTSTTVTSIANLPSYIDVETMDYVPSATDLIDRVGFVSDEGTSYILV
ncbi:MAG: hypothetical protein DRN30_03730 [Thermoplasmata archaeon]|nr:MAG: hypothetical protein DRN30_03730 [Thermoplasmata archaeon]